MDRMDRIKEKDKGRATKDEGYAIEAFPFPLHYSSLPLISVCPVYPC
jgi:hypothetical protein